MSKYTPLWEWIRQHGEKQCTLTFAYVEEILGFPIDHAFLTYKKELSDYGYKVSKISKKEQTILIEKL